MQVEYMGGFAGDVRAYMAKLGVSVNTTVVENMHRQYAALMAKGYKPPVFTGEQMSATGVATMQALKEATQQSAPTARAFLKGLYVLAKAGKIPAAKYDPKGFQTAEEARKGFRSEQGVLDTLTKGIKGLAGAGKLVVLALGLGVAGYAIYKLGPRGSGRAA